MVSELDETFGAPGSVHGAVEFSEEGCGGPDSGRCIW